MKIPQNIEVFKRTKAENLADGWIIEGEVLEPGWYYWYCFPGCLPEGDLALGPFRLKTEAIKAARLFLLLE